MKSVIAKDFSGLKAGEIITIAGKYDKETFWQWITQKPKQLTKFKVII